MCTTNPKQHHIDGYKNICNNAKCIHFVEVGNDFEAVDGSPSTHKEAIKKLNTRISRKRQN